MYKYYLAYQTRSKQVEPKNALKIIVEREQDEAFFREKLSGSLQVAGDDFDFLWDARRFSVQCCQQLTLSIYRTCGNGNSLIWSGYFNLFDIDWDVDNRTATVEKISVQDSYNAILSNYHVEINILDYQNHVDWANPVLFPKIFRQTTQPSVDYNPTGSDLYDTGFLFSNAILYLVQQVVYGTPHQSIGETTPLQMSQFLCADVNPVTTKYNQLKDTVMMHISQAKRPGATNRATKGIITLKDMLSEIKKLCNAYWLIQDGKFRVEHLSYFTNYSYDAPTVTLDLTAAKFKETMSGLSRFSYQTEKLKGSEGVEHSVSRSAFEAESTITTYYDLGSPEFSGAYLSYSESCVPKNEKGEKISQFESVNLFTTDFQSIQNKPDTFPEEDVWALVHVKNFTGTDCVQYGWLPISGERKRNGSLSASRLYWDFLRYETSFQYGIFSAEKEKPKYLPADGPLTERPLRNMSVKRIITYPAVTLSMCCGEAYNFSGLIKHPLADKCVVENITYDLLLDSLELTFNSANECSDVPFPDYQEEEEPDPNCPIPGKVLRVEEIRQVAAAYDNIDGINYKVDIVTSTTYFADGFCGEYSTVQVERVLSTV